MIFTSQHKYNFSVWSNIYGDKIMPKKRLTITVDPEIMAWVERRVKNKIFASISHGFEYAIHHLIEEEKKNT